MPTKIKSIKAREILDSRGQPTVRVKVLLTNGSVGVASVPSGASTGSYEALELRDGDKIRYGGKGVLKAVKNVNKIIAPKLIGKDPTSQQQIDKLMIKLDGTKNKSRIGANAILGVSLAVAQAGAQALNLPLYQYLRQIFRLNYKNWRLPLPMMNILNGGAHANWSLDIQEFIIVPLQKIFKERVRCGAEIFQTLGQILRAKGYSTLKGDEGGYAPKLPGNESAFRLILQAIKKANYRAGWEVKLAVDMAASEFYNPKTKKYQLKADKKILTAEQMIKLEENWLKKYPIISIEDGLAEDDWQNWLLLTKKLGRKINLVGDDLFVTNPERLKQGIRFGIANAILIKPNQIGTLTETIETIKLAQKNNYKVIISHRSGETEDTFIADLAVAVNAEFIKTGSLSRSERVAKYNWLLEIEKEITGK